MGRVGFLQLAPFTDETISPPGFATEARLIEMAPEQAATRNGLSPRWTCPTGQIGQCLRVQPETPPRREGFHLTSARTAANGPRSDGDARAVSLFEAFQVGNVEVTRSYRNCHQFPAVSTELINLRH